MFLPKSSRLTWGVAAVIVLLLVWLLFLWWSDRQFFWAVSNGNHGAVQRWLMLRPGLIDASLDNGETGLHMAVERNDIEMAKLFVTKGADVNRDSARLARPLNFAAQLFEGEAIVEFLIEAGADVNGRSMNDVYETPMKLACIGGPGTMELLLKHGAEVDPRDGHGGTPLHTVITYSRITLDEKMALVKLLLQHGADVNARNNRQETPLYWAKKREHLEYDPAPLVNLLIRNGAVE